MTKRIKLPEILLSAVALSFFAFFGTASAAPGDDGAKKPSDAAEQAVAKDKTKEQIRAEQKSWRESFARQIEENRSKRIIDRKDQGYRPGEHVIEARFEYEIDGAAVMSFPVKEVPKQVGKEALNAKNQAIVESIQRSMGLHEAQTVPRVPSMTYYQGRMYNTVFLAPELAKDPSSLRRYEGKEVKVTIRQHTSGINYLVSLKSN